MFRSGTHIEPLQHVSAPQHSPAIVKPIADRATPNSGPVFATGGGEGAHEAVATVKSQSADRGESIPLGAPTAPTQQSAIPLPITGSIPAPPPAPPSQVIPAPPPAPPASSTTFSAKVNPIKPPGAKVHAGNGVEREYSSPIRHTTIADEGNFHFPGYFDATTIRLFNKSFRTLCKEKKTDYSLFVKYINKSNLI